MSDDKTNIDDILGDDPSEDLELDKQEEKTSDAPQELESPKEESKDEEQPTDDGEQQGEDKPTENSSENLPEQSAEEPKEEPLTMDKMRSLVSDIRREERESSKIMDELTNEVVEKFYPDGLSTEVVDANGNVYATPADVVRAVEESGQEITMEEASQWLMNEKFKKEKEIAEIRQSAQEVAEVNRNFRDGAERVLQKYDKIFEAYPELQQKVYKNYMKTVKIDGERDLVLSAPDIEEYYDDILEPYRLAFEFSQQNQPAHTQQEASKGEGKVEKPAEEKQTYNDRLDETGDGGVDNDTKPDPNDPNATLNSLFKE